MQRIIYLVVVLVSALAGSGCERQPEIQPSGGVVRVGVIGPLGGQFAVMGEDGLQGINTAMVMRPLLDNGDRVELVLEDDRNRPALTLEAMEKLAMVDEVAAILLMSTSASALEAAAVADRYRVPILAVIATHPGVTEGNSFISQLSFDDIFQGAVAALYVMDELLIEDVAVISDPESFHSRKLAEEFIGKYESIGGEVKGRVPVARHTGDYVGILNELREEGVKLIYLPVRAKDLLPVDAALKEIGWEVQVMVSDGLLSSMKARYGDRVHLLDNVLATDIYSSNTAQDTPFGRKASKVYASLYEQEPTTHTALGAEGYAILINALNRCTNPGDRECINTMLRNTRNFVGLLGRISILPSGKAERPLLINRIDDGKTEFVVKVR